MSAGRESQREARPRVPLRSALAVAAATLVIACNSLLGIPDIERDFGDGGSDERDGSSGSSGSTVGTGGCTASQKPCDGRCVAIDSPVTGCGAVSCAPCYLAHATATCVEGACAPSVCERGFDDCNLRPDDGCEAPIGSNDHCSTCDDRCRNGKVCESSDGEFTCACTGPDQCGAGGTCTNGRCYCDKDGFCPSPLLCYGDAGCQLAPP